MKNTSIQILMTIALASAAQACGSSSKTTKTEPLAPPVQEPVAEVAPSPQPEPIASPVTSPPEVAPTSPVPMDLMAIEMAAYEAAKPVFVEECGMCHTPKAGKKGGKGLTHFSMGGYPFEGHHKTKLGQSIRLSLGAAGKPATMPKSAPGSVEGENLEVLLAWADAFDNAKSAGVGYHAEASEEGHSHPKKHGHKKKHGHSKKGKKHDHKKKHQH